MGDIRSCRYDLSITLLTLHIVAGSNGFMCGYYSVQVALL